MVDLLPKLEKPYTKFCAGIPSAQKLYEEKRVEKVFIEFEGKYASLNKPTLNHIMRPVQRIMKYPLLIHEVMKRASLAPPLSKYLAQALETGVIVCVCVCALRRILSATDKVCFAFPTATNLAQNANLTMDQPVRKLDKMDISQPSAEKVRQEQLYAHRGKKQLYAHTEKETNKHRGSLTHSLAHPHPFPHPYSHPYPHSLTHSHRHAAREGCWGCYACSSVRGTAKGGGNSKEQERPRHNNAHRERSEGGREREVASCTLLMLIFGLCSPTSSIIVILFILSSALKRGVTA
jgi:hypothetical protein